MHHNYCSFAFNILLFFSLSFTSLSLFLFGASHSHLSLFLSLVRHSHLTDLWSKSCHWSPRQAHSRHSITDAISEAHSLMQSLKLTHHATTNHGQSFVWSVGFGVLILFYSLFDQFWDFLFEKIFFQKCYRKKCNIISKTMLLLQPTAGKYIHIYNKFRYQKKKKKKKSYRFLIYINFCRKEVLLAPLNLFRGRNLYIV